jgi:cbb3-type cytochrome oxidase subunit 3
MITAIVGYVLLVLWTIYVLMLGILLGAIVFDPEKRAEVDELGTAMRLLLAVALWLWPFAAVLGLILDKKEKLED